MAICRCALVSHAHMCGLQRADILRNSFAVVIKTLAMKIVTVVKDIAQSSVAEFSAPDLNAACVG